MNNRYDNVPLSEKTRQGMSLKIDDLSAIGRMLTLQDDAYDERFEELTGLMKSIMNTVVQLQSDVKELSRVVLEMQKEIRDHDTRIKSLEIQMQKLLNEHNLHHK